jgi:hypothetical protein
MRVMGARHSLAFRLIGCSGLLFATALFFAFVWPLTPGRLARPSAELFDGFALWSAVAALRPFVPESSGAVAVLLLAAIGLAFGGWALALLWAWNREGTPGERRLATAGALLLFATSALALPNVNTDLFNYILRGRLVAVHGQNLYYVAADAIPADPIHRYASHRFTAEATGKLPAWEWIDIALARVAGDDPATIVLVYRFAFFALNAAALLLLSRTLARFEPRRTLAGIVAYGFCPVVFGFGESKTDTVTVFYLLLGAWLLVANHPRAAVVPFTLSILVKLITLPLMAVYGLRELRLRRFRHAAAALAIGVATTLAAYAPFLRGPELLLEHLGFVSGPGASSHGGAGLPRALAAAGFALLVLAAGLLQDGSPRRLFRGWAVVLLYFSVLLSPLGLSWYGINLVAVASLAVEGRILILTATVCAASFAINLWDSTFTPEFPVPDLLSVPRHVLYLSIASGAGLAAAAATLARHVARRRSRRGETASLLC